MQEMAYVTNGTKKRHVYRPVESQCGAPGFFQDFLLEGVTVGAGQTGTPLGACGLGGVTSMLGV
jgi:hypothetical protein